MRWAVQTIQGAFDNFPLCFDTANRAAIEAGLSVYNRSKGKPIINSADAGEQDREYRPCSSQRRYRSRPLLQAGVPADNDERMAYLQELLERGLSLGLEAEDMWFDPLFLVIKGMQDKQMTVLEFIRMCKDMGLKTTGGLSNVSNGMPKHIRPIMDSAMVAMAIQCGLTSAIANPSDRRLMETIKSCDIITNETLYADSYLDI
jgi:5-methyltetrahydrofolate corrinoid/iron sulfur protein methyltransferase